MRYWILVPLLALAPLGTVLADAVGCDSGTVYEDRNGNGLRDRGEHGLADIAVSDGERLVRTDALGRYRLPPRSGTSLFVVKPAGYQAPRRADGLPDTWINRQTEPGPTLKFGGVPSAPAACHDFALRRESRRQARSPLEVLVLGDPQPKTSRQVDYYRRDIVAPLRGQEWPRLAISLGDLVDDNLALYPEPKAVDAGLGKPWLHVPGNHDLDFDAERDELSLSSFHQAFGPDTYAWEEAGTSFIVLDDVIYRPGQRPAYIGGLRESQFRFLDAYLAGLPRSQLVVVAVHIPFFDAEPGRETFRHADRDRLFALLQRFPRLLLLSAHTHAQRHYFHDASTGWHGDRPLHEFNMGAACGGYWSGVADAEGIPAATMSDGTPNGYARLSIGGDGDYRLRWFPARAPAEAQIGLHGPRVLRQGGYPGYGIYANVYMGQDDTPVEFRIDDGPWQAMTHVLQADPAMLAENLADDQATQLRSYDRSPEATPSQHLWRGTLPTSLASGEHRVQVRATIAGYGEARAEWTYRLESAAP